MIERLKELGAPRVRAWWVALGWALFVIGCATLESFRGFKTSGFSRLLRFEDVPILYFMDNAWPGLAWALGCVGALVCVGLCVWAWGRRDGWSVGGAVWGVACVGFGVWGLRYRWDEGVLWLPSLGWADWGTVVLGSVASGWVMWGLREEGVEAETTRPSSTGLGVVYLLGALAVFAHGAWDHVKMWYPDWNGGYSYARFFGEGELVWAVLVLMSTSLLFGSLAGGLAACWSALFGSLGRRRIGLAGQSYAAAWLVSLAVNAPWITRILGEIAAEGQWVSVVTVLALSAAGLAPLLWASAALLDGDVAPAGDRVEEAPAGAESVGPKPPTRAEVCLSGWLLAPVYGVLRVLRPRTPEWSFRVTFGLALGVLAAFTWGVHGIESWWDFDDWRGMMKMAEFPSLRVWASLLSASAVVLVGVRVGGQWVGRLKRGAPGWCVRGVVLSCLVFASWPVWGWSRVPENVFTRCVEFNDRHEFELRFLQWLTDIDRDGYSRAFHGGDPDDADPQVQSAGLPPLRELGLAEDVMVVTDPARAEAFPSLVVLFLEGVTPRAITGYGLRDLGGRQATPAMDALVSEGVRFEQAFAQYPSTWDGWFMVHAGRLLRISEMDASQPFGDRYSRFHNLYKLTKALEFERYCHSSLEPFTDLFVPQEDHALDWEHGFDSSVSWEDEDEGITGGDKRNARILRFLDSLEPGERFYLTEHMSDTHFPWRRTSDERARELGWEDGLSFVEEDAYVDGMFIDRMARYYQAISRMDTQIRDIVDKLKEVGRYEDTLIVIVGDHGCQWYEHEHGYYVSHLYQQSLQIPVILRGPGVPAGVAVEEPVLQIDLVPTLMDLAGVGLETERPLEGLSVAPLWEEETAAAERARYRERDLLLKTHYDTFGLIRGFRHKLVVDRPTGGLWLFDLEDDPGEMRNLVDAEPALVEEMLGALREAGTSRQGMTFLGGLAPSGAAAARVE